MASLQTRTSQSRATSSHTSSLLTVLYTQNLQGYALSLVLFLQAKKLFVFVVFIPVCVVWQLNYVLNTLLSLHMVVAFLVALVLDNTVPGSRQERGVYVWSEPEAARREPAVCKDYELPFRVGRVFRWVKWVGLWETGARLLGPRMLLYNFPAQLGWSWSGTVDW